jgi:hypothetical protein
LAWSLAAICQCRSGPSIEPLGRLALVVAIAARTAEVAMP